MMLQTPSSPHVHSAAGVSSVMLRVVYALIPAIAVFIWLFGWGVVTNLVLAVITALGAEAAMLALRDKPVRTYLLDGSALVTGLLLGLALPPLSPWWLIVISTAFAMIFAKHLFGGLGYNPFNPAMVGYVMALISFPREMTRWAAPLSLDKTSLDLPQSLGWVFTSSLPGGLAVDSFTSATPLDTLRTQLHLNQDVSAIMSASPVFGQIGGTGWEWVNLAFLAGGVWLLYKRVITWHVPAGMLLALFIIASIFHLVDPARYASPVFHVFSGAALVGAFFIATDPVSGAATPKGRIIFGAGVGLFTYIIRTWGGYPDGVAFAVLLMNMAAPTIDYYTKPRVFGHGGK